MALDRTKLQRVGGVIPQLHIYDAGADAIATVTASGYFNAVTDQLRQKDVIIVIGGATTTIDMIFVNSATGATTVTTVSVEGVTGTLMADDQSRAAGKGKAAKDAKGPDGVVIPKNEAEAKVEAKADKDAEVKDKRAAEDRAEGRTGPR